ASLAKSAASIDRAVLSGSQCAWMSMTPSRVWAASVEENSRRGRIRMNPYYGSAEECTPVFRRALMPRVSSKRQVQRELPRPRRFLSADLAEIGIRWVGCRPAQHRLVQSIERVGAEFHLEALVNREGLVQREVPSALRIETNIAEAQRKRADI